MHNKVLEAKKEEETFSVNYKYHHNWNISNVLNAADLLCRVIFIYTYLCNIPVQFEAFWDKINTMPSMVFCSVFFSLNNELQSNHEILLIIYCLWMKWAILIDNYTKKERKNIAL